MIVDGHASRLMKYDREREDEGLAGNIKFPALEELIDRDRLWPPDLGKLSLEAESMVERNIW